MISQQLSVSGLLEHEELAKLANSISNDQREER